MYVAHNENSYDQKCNISTLGPQRLCIELPVRKIWLFSHLHILLYCFLFEWRGKRNKNFLLIVQFQGTESQEILHE